jgi:hypothetical protein
LVWLTADSGMACADSDTLAKSYDKREGGRTQGDSRCDARQSKNKIENASMVVAKNHFILSEP